MNTQVKQLPAKEEQFHGLLLDHPKQPYRLEGTPSEERFNLFISSDSMMTHVDPDPNLTHLDVC